ncbi:MAG: YbaN family protein [Acutalibacteraceae bacterium]
MMKYIYLTLAFLCLICGSVGIVIPGLPTTPLLLAASFFFAKGSDRFHRWFLGTKLYHKHLESFVQHKTMKRTKVYILMFSTCSMGLSITWSRIYMFAFLLQPYLPFNICASFL